MKIMRIRELRESKGLLQAQLAIQMGVMQSTVSNWESEIALPRARELPRLAQTLGCAIDELYYRGGDDECPDEEAE